MGLEETIRKFFFRKPKNELEGDEMDKKPNLDNSVAHKCEKCRTIVLTEEKKENLHVCPKCGHHDKIGARERIIAHLDESSFVELDGEMVSDNKLNFPEYDEKLEKARNNSSENEGVVCGHGLIDGQKTVVFAMEYRFMMGSMGSVVGEKITRAFEYATKNSLPIIGFTLSGGARMQEGILSLMQMAKTSSAAKRHAGKKLLYVAVQCNPTTGGVTASFASNADIIIAEPSALVGFAGPRVIEQTLRQKLPQKFQTAEFVQDKGFIDLIVDRRQLKTELGKILAIHSGGIA